MKNTFNGTFINNSKTGAVPLYKPIDIKEVAFSELVAFINEIIEEQPQTFQPHITRYDNGRPNDPLGAELLTPRF